LARQIAYKQPKSAVAAILDAGVGVGFEPLSIVQSAMLFAHVKLTHNQYGLLKQVLAFITKTHVLLAPLTAISKWKTEDAVEQQIYSTVRLYKYNNVACTIGKYFFQLKAVGYHFVIDQKSYV
jgi:hypothetical protein